MKTRFVQKKFLILAGIILVTAAESDAGTHVVSNTNDSGPGSLREALTACGAEGRDTVAFNIPATDPGYDPATGVRTIRPAAGYDVPEGTTVDGTVAVPIAGGGNALRPGIEINGTELAQQGIIGLWLYGGVTLRGLVVNHFQYGLWVASPNVTVERCFVGTDPSGRIPKPNGINGILLINGATGAVIQENLISGNSGYGIRISGGSTSGNIIRNNRIGTDSTGTAALPNGSGGIYLQGGTHDNIIEQNLTSGNNGIGIHLSNAGTNGNLIRDNRIGTDVDGSSPLPNTTFGVAFFDGPSNNRVGPGNRIAFNGKEGALVDGNDSFTGTIGNTVMGNSITANGNKGIWNFRGGNAELAPPTITSLTPAQIAGTAGPEQTVAVYLDENDEGAFFVGSTTTDAGGNFILSVMIPLPGLPYVTATVTDTAGNTSEFSAPFLVSGIEEEGSPVSREFFLHQNYPNPFNRSTKVVYSIPKTGRVRLTVYDILGREVLILVNEMESAGTHAVWFDAPHLSSGIYVYRIEADDKVQSKKLILTM